MNQPQSAVGNCLDVQSFINAQPLSRYQWRVVLLGFLSVFLDGLDTAAMGFIAPALSQDWGIDRASLGPVMSAALIGMVFGALGSGPLADRFGRKVVLVSAVLVFGGFTLVFIAIDRIAAAFGSTDLTTGFWAASLISLILAAALLGALLWRAVRDTSRG